MDVYVSTCRKYATRRGGPRNSTLLEDFRLCFDAVWPAPGVDVYFCDPNTNAPWADNLDDWLAARATNEPFVYLQDDYMLCDVDVPAVQWARVACRFGAGCVRLHPCPPPARELPEEPISRIDAAEPYSLSLQAAMWRPDCLRSLLARGMSPWQFENPAGNGTAAQCRWPIYSFPRNRGAVGYTELYQKGRELPDARAYVERVYSHTHKEQQ